MNGGLKSSKKCPRPGEKKIETSSDHAGTVTCFADEDGRAGFELAGQRGLEPPVLPLHERRRFLGVGGGDEAHAAAPEAGAAEPRPINSRSPHQDLAEILQRLATCKK